MHESDIKSGSMNSNQFNLHRSRVCHALRQTRASQTRYNTTRVRGQTRGLATQQTEGYDIVLSSGFLAFAQHAGFLQACTDLDVPVRAVCGTSSGALIGSMYCAGYTPREIAAEFSRIPPIQRLALQTPLYPWAGGVLSLSPVVDTLKQLLPLTFEELKKDFACAVVDRNGEHVLLDSGLGLPEAVTASAAVPVLFAKVDIPEQGNGPFIDGGVKCRIGLDIWRDSRYSSLADSSPAIVHLIGRSSPFSGNDETGGLATQKVTLVQSPKSRSSLWDLSEFDEQFELSRQRALKILRPLTKAAAAI